MSFLTYDTADDMIFSFEIIEKFLFPETDFWYDNYLKGVSSPVAHKKGGFLGFFLNVKTAGETNDILRIFKHIFIQR